MNETELIKYLNKYFTYHSDGTLTRSDRKNSNGFIDRDGYLRIKIKGKIYLSHRLIFAMFNGKLPKEEIDHINRIRTDNRIENLREVDRLTNVKNTTRKVNPDTGVIGVYVDKSTKGLKKKYAFRHKGKMYRFYTLEEAVIKRSELHGDI